MEEKRQSWRKIDRGKVREIEGERER